MFRTMDYVSPAVVIYWFFMIVFGSYFVVRGGCSFCCPWHHTLLITAATLQAMHYTHLPNV
jgi:hypothetical protein